MPKQEGQKSKLLTLLRILEQKTDEEHLLNVRACSRMVIHRTPAVIFTVKYIHPDAVFRIIGIVIEHHRFISTVHVKVIEHKSGTVCSPSGIYK